MAGVGNKIKIKVDLQEIERLNKEIKDVKNQILNLNGSDVQKYLDELNSKYESLTKQLQIVGEEAMKTAREIDSLSEKYNQQKNTIEEYQDQIISLTNDLKSSLKGANDAEYSHIESKLNNIIEAYKKVSAEAESTRISLSQKQTDLGIESIGDEMKQNADKFLGSMTKMREIIESVNSMSYDQAVDKADNLQEKISSLNKEISILAENQTNSFNEFENLSFALDTNKMVYDEALKDNVKVTSEKVEAAKEDLDSLTALLKENKVVLADLGSEYEIVLSKIGEHSSQAKTKLDNSLNPDDFNQYVSGMSDSLSSLDKKFSDLIKKSSEISDVQGLKDYYDSLSSIEEELSSIIEKSKGFTENETETKQYQVAVNLLKEVKSELKEVGKYTNQNTDKYEKQIKILTQMRNIREEMSKLVNEDGSVSPQNLKKYDELRDKLSEVGTAYRRVQQEQKLFTTAGNSQLAGIIQGITGIAGAFTAFQGIASLVVKNNERLAAIQTKLQAAMSITMGLQSVSNTLHATSNFRIVTVTKATQLLSSANTWLTTTFGMSNVAAKALMATLTLGLSLAISGIIYLLDKQRKKQEKLDKKNKEGAEKSIEFNNKVAESLSLPLIAYKKLQKQWENLSGSLKEKKKFIEENKKEFEKLNIEINNVSDAENVLVSNTAAVLSALKLRAQAIAYQELATESYKKAAKSQIEADKFVVDNTIDFNPITSQQKELTNKIIGNTKEIFKEAASINEKEGEKIIDIYLDLQKKATEELSKAGINEYNDKNNNSQSAATKAQKLEQELLSLKDKLSNEQIRQKLESDQKLLDLDEDSFQKQLKQNELNYQKELQQIKEFEDNKNKERAEAVLKFGEKNVPVSLSEEVVSFQSGKLKDEAFSSFEKANKDVLKSLTEKYQSYADQRLEIEKKFNADIEALESQLPKNKLSALEQSMNNLFGEGIGNVDLLARPMIDAAELAKKGWEDAGEGIATVFSSQFGILDQDGKEVEILVTPILPNGDVLSPDELEQYIDNVLQGNNIVKADNLGIVIGIDVDKDGNAGEILHQLQEQMVNIKNSAPELEKKLSGAIAKATADKGKTLMSFDFDRLKESPEYVRAFEDLKNTSSETLNSLLSQLQNAKETAAKVLSPDQLREYTSTIQSIMDELVDRNPFQLLVDKKKELEKAEKELAKAQSELNKIRSGESVITSSINNEGKLTVTYLSEKDALERVKEAKDKYNTASNEVIKTNQKIYDRVDQLSKAFSSLGDSMGDTTGQVLSLMGDIGQFAVTSMEGIEKVSLKGAAAITTVEKASIILTIISTAIKLMRELESIMPDAFQKYQNYNEKVRQINDMRQAVNDYELAVLKARQAESSWFGKDSIRDLKNLKEQQDKVSENYYKKAGEAQAIYQNEGGGGWLTNTFKSAVNWVSKITYGFKLLKNEYKEGTTAAIDNLRIETRKKSKGFLSSGIGGKSQKTEDLVSWVKNETGLDLFDNKGMIDIDLAKQIIEKQGDKLVGQTKETLEELIKYREEYDEYIKSLREYVSTMYEPLTNNMVQAVWDWFDEGKDALDSYKDYAAKTFRDIASDMIKSMIKENIFGDYEKQLAEMYDKYFSGEINDDQLMKGITELTNKVNDRYEKELPILQNGLNAIAQGIKNDTGIDIKSTDKSSQQSTKGYSTTMDQDTGGAILGRVTGIHDELIQIGEDVAYIAKWNQPFDESLLNLDSIAGPLGSLNQSALNIEQMIEENRNISLQLYYVVKDIKADTSHLQEMNDRLGKIEKNTQGLTRK